MRGIKHLACLLYPKINYTKDIVIYPGVQSEKWHPMLGMTNMICILQNQTVRRVEGRLQGEGQKGDSCEGYSINVGERWWWHGPGMQQSGGKKSSFWMYL